MREPGIHPYNGDGSTEQHGQAIEWLKRGDLGAVQFLRYALASLALLVASPRQHTSEPPSGKCSAKLSPCSLGPELVAAATAVQQHGVRLRGRCYRFRDDETVLDRVFHPITQRRGTQGTVTRHGVLRACNVMRDIVEPGRKRLARAARAKGAVDKLPATSERPDSLKGVYDRIVGLGLD